jgi:hypothetical protein
MMANCILFLLGGEEKKAFAYLYHADFQIFVLWKLN